MWFRLLVSSFDGLNNTGAVDLVLTCGEARVIVCDSIFTNNWCKYFDADAKIIFVTLIWLSEFRLLLFWLCCVL